MTIIEKLTISVLIIVVMLMAWTVYFVPNGDSHKETNIYQEKIISEDEQVPKTISCGDGVVEKKETSENCCLDTGCNTNEICFKNQCSKKEEGSIVSKFTLDPPTIDGKIEKDEWSGSSVYPLEFGLLNGPGRPDNSESFMEMRVLHDFNNIYIALFIKDPSKDTGESSLPIPEDIRRGSDKVGIYFDEGKNIKLGSREMDRELTFEQEYAMYISGDNTVKQGGVWHDWSQVSPNFNPGWMWGAIGSKEEIDMSFHENHWEAEFKVSLVDQENEEGGGTETRGLSINPKIDRLGFTIYFSNNDGSEEYAQNKQYAEYHVAIKNTMEYGRGKKIIRIRDDVEEPSRRLIISYYPKNWPIMEFDNYLAN